ncbi:MAG TPA: HepT-like ribonuclease domain-containing protein [Acetobacteraceae bacterium]
MPVRSISLRLDDMIEAAERIRDVLGALSLDAFEGDWQLHWLVQRGIEIISEASRHLPAEMKARHADIPWTKVAGIGNVLRHGYEDIAAPISGSSSVKTCRNSNKYAVRSAQQSRDMHKGLIEFGSKAPGKRSLLSNLRPLASGLSLAQCNSPGPARPRQVGNAPEQGHSYVAASLQLRSPAAAE